MPLPTSLHSADLTFDRPSCNHALVKSGRWFQMIGRFKCNGCQRQVRLTYADKLALFARHAHVAVQSPVTNDVTELVHNKKAAWRRRSSFRPGSPPALGSLRGGNSEGGCQ